MNKLSFLRDKVMIHPIVGAINKAELQKWIKGYTDPVIDILIWLIPIGAVLASLATLAVWFTKDDELKEREKPSRIIKKIVFWAFVGTGIVAIFKALGITSSGIGWLNVKDYNSHHSMVQIFAMGHCWNISFFAWLSVESSIKNWFFEYRWKYNNI